MLTVTDNTAQATTISKIEIGTSALTVTTDYTIDGLKVTLLKTTLDNLAVGKHTVTFTTNWGKVTATVDVVDTTPEG